MAHTIGIIGGADGPTAIFVTGNPVPVIFGLAGIVAAVLLAIRLIKKK